MKDETPDDVLDSLRDRCEVLDWPKKPTSWMKTYVLDQSEVDAMLDAEFLVPGLVISGQVTVIAAKPGCGKTSILMECGKDIASKGFDLAYVNMDCGAADLKYWRRAANDGGFDLVTPHFYGSSGIEGWLHGLTAMLDRAEDLSRMVIVVDTLKKITDLMNKARAKHAMSILRGLSTLGCTVICAAHCNKHRTPDGKLMFEGVGDIESDCDNLVYLESSERDQFGTKTVTTEPSDKVRGVFEKRTWQIREDRSVIPSDVVVDVVGEQQALSQREEDATAIDVVVSGIESGKHKRIDLFNYVRENGIGERRFRTVIKRYCEGRTDAKTAPIWRTEKQKANNSDYYILL